MTRFLNAPDAFCAFQRMVRSSNSMSHQCNLEELLEEIEFSHLLIWLPTRTKQAGTYFFKFHWVRNWAILGVTQNYLSTGTLPHHRSLIAYRTNTSYRGMGQAPYVDISISDMIISRSDIPIIKCILAVLPKVNKVDSIYHLSIKSQAHLGSSAQLPSVS